MNEEEFKKYGEKLETWMSLSGDSKDECIWRYPVEVRIQADIARQLTRIADQGDKILNPTTLEKLDRLNLFLQYALKEDAKKPPTPDALVEAVKTISNGKLTLKDLKEYAKTKNIPVMETDSHMSLDRKIAAYALAAHEKAGG